MPSIQSLRLISMVVLLSLTGQSIAQTTLAGQRHDGPGRVAASTSTFSVGVSRDSGATFVSTAAVYQNVLIRGEIRAEAANVGQPADIFVVDRLLDTNSFLMRISSGAWVSWNGNVSLLQPFREDEVLDAVESLDLFTGTLATAGDHRFFLGYMPADGILRYHSSGLPLNIAAPPPDVDPIQLYKNGFVYSWSGFPLVAERGGIQYEPRAAVTNNLNGDALVLAVTYSSSSACQAGCLLRLSPSSFNAPDMALYYPSGHLQFDIKLAPGSQLSKLVLTGTSCTSSPVVTCASQQSGTIDLDPANYNTSSFTHVSVPIASLYPPTAIGTKVPYPFSIRLFSTSVSASGGVYLDDIKWTKN